MAANRMAGPDRLSKPVSSANARKALDRIEAECRALLGRGPSESLCRDFDRVAAQTEESVMALEEFLAEAKKLWNLS